jgi:predicted AlkP superfamily phosphohydrolase/phosphomutase
MVFKWNFLRKPKKSPDKKAVVMGLDGVPYSLLRAYVEQGVMPRLGEMVAEGMLLPLKSSLPEVSSVAWSSFMTGRNPGEHNIFGFMEIDPDTYEYQFPNFASLRTPPFWEALDIPTVAFNIPQTYPARPMNGVMVSGFVSLELEKAVYPGRVCDYLKNLDYRLDVQTNLASRDPEAFFDNLFYTFAKRMEAIKHLFDEENWQIFIGTITETDRLHHFFFNNAQGGKYQEIFLRFYRQLDEFLGEMHQRSQKEKALFLTCSDHGFAPIETEVYVNHYLEGNGFLKISGSEGLKGMTRESRAFCLDPARVYIHRKGKYALGGVDEAEYDDLRHEIKQLFGELTYNGAKVVKHVFLKEEIFSGPYLENAPDLYILAKPGFDLKSGLNKSTTFGLSHFTGAHTYEDAHFYISDSSISGIPPELCIDNIAGLITNHLING